MAATTREKIFAIADQMDADGENPTYTAVRKKLGGGSFTTISEAMGEWKAKRKAGEKPPVSEPAPETLVNRLTDLGGEIWALALEMASGRLAVEREAMDAAKLAMEAERTEAIELADQVTAELEAIQGQMADQKTAEAAARQETEKVRAQVAGLAERAATAEARAGEIEKRADDLNAELVRVNQANAELVQALAEAAKKPAEPTR